MEEIQLINLLWLSPLEIYYSKLKEIQEPTYQVKRKDFLNSIDKKKNVDGKGLFIDDYA